MTITDTPAPDTPSSDTPAVTVVMPVHNGERFVEAALRSIMTQTLRDIEILVIDDGSKDGTPAILERLAAEDDRIRVERFEVNRQVPGAVNHALGLARAPLVARMDADDVAHPERLTIQKRYLDEHPGVLAVGSSLRRITAEGAVFQTAVRPRDAMMCRWILRFRLPVTNPSTLMRYPLPDGGRPLFDPAYPWCDDYDFFARLVEHGDVVCLPEVLLDYRHHPASISHARWAEQNRHAKEISLAYLGRELPPEVVEALGPALAAFFDDGARPAAPEILRGFKAMLRHDLRRWPRRATWLRRQTAQLAFETLGRVDHTPAQAVRAMARSAPGLVMPLALRAAEGRGALRRALSTNPDVWGAPSEPRPPGGASAGAAGRGLVGVDHERVGL